LNVYKWGIRIVEHFIKFSFQMSQWFLRNILKCAVNGWISLTDKKSIWEIVTWYLLTWWWGSLELNQQVLLDFDSASLLKQQFTDRNITPLEQAIMIPRQSVLKATNTNQTHNLLHLRCRSDDMHNLLNWIFRILK
jgi:hypothetical protein